MKTSGPITFGAERIDGITAIQGFLPLFIQVDNYQIKAQTMASSMHRLITGFMQIIRAVF
jgi:hypothetical protein